MNGVINLVNTMETTAKIIIAIGFIVMIGGIILLLSAKMGLGTFRLPGDIVIKRDNFTFYFPWVTCIVISIILSVIFSIFIRK